MSDIPRQLRRRRAAADRCEPLEDGRRDPLDPRPRTNAKRRVVSIMMNTARNVALVKGWGTRQLIIDSGHTPIWSAVGRGWCIDAKHVPDVEAMAQLERRFVNVREIGGGP